MSLALINALVIAVASQTTATAPPSTVVCSADLDLRTAQGAADLRGRIDRTVVRLSGGAAAQPGSFLESASLAAARAEGRRQADDLIRDARRSGETRVAVDGSGRPAG